MTAGILPAASLCLASGGLLGAFFLALKLLRTLLTGGRLCAALLDMIFCLCSAVLVFLCALAVDQGRLRLFQGLLQILGAWGVIAALDPGVEGAARLIRRVRRTLAGWTSRFFRRWVRRPLAAFGKGAGALVLRPIRALMAKRREKRARKQRKKAPAGKNPSSKSPIYRGKGAPGPRNRKKTGSRRKKPKKPLEKLT